MPSPSSTFSITPGPIEGAFTACCRHLEQRRFVDALWQQRSDVWSDDPAVQKLVAGRLGWLRALDTVVPLLPRLRAAAEGVERDGFTDVVLLGMGGSSLGPEVLRQVVGPRASAPRFRVLDSVDPESVRDAMDRVSTSLFVLASKSGSTIEPTAMAAEARRRLVDAGHADWGGRFIAITDEGTALHRHALAERFREVFVNPSDIGGRYSVLSLFGMVPAALMGIDLGALCAQARAMEAACRATPISNNPGLALGAIMAAGATAGRDKLTLAFPARLGSLGLWVEQLVAESTGKRGKGVVPVVDEPRASVRGGDRLLVSSSLGDEHPEDLDLDLVTAQGVPLVSLQVPEPMAIAAEFLRWEVATATAGFLLAINPFDEPNVQQAKAATRTLLDAYAEGGRLPVPEPDARLGGVRWTLSEAARRERDGQAAAFLDVLRPGDYCALLAYLPPDDRQWASLLEVLRARVAHRTGCATTSGYGPRYLHSTGQLHKGGPNHGVFVIVVAPPAEDLPVPGEPYSFAVLETAQALGDFQSLDHAGRRALMLQLEARDVQLLQGAIDALIAPD